MENKETTQGKFKLSGDIEARRESNYVRIAQMETIERQRKVVIVAAILLVLLAVFSVLLMFRVSNLSSELQKREMGDDQVLQIDSNRISQEYVDSLVRVNAMLQRDNELLVENSDRTDGVFFEIQLGSFTDFDLDGYIEQLAHLRQEKYDGKTKLLLGKFRSFKKALLFENDLKKIGMKDVYIVGRIDGRLVPYKEALEEVQMRK